MSGFMRFNSLIIGHSTCYDDKICVQPCDDLTTGTNCEQCSAGYWGNPINGGSCQKCECNGMFDFEFDFHLFAKLPVPVEFRYYIIICNINRSSHTLSCGDSKMLLQYERINR